MDVHVILVVCASRGTLTIVVSHVMIIGLILLRHDVALSMGTEVCTVEQDAVAAVVDSIGACVTPHWPVASRCRSYRHSCCSCHNLHPCSVLTADQTSS